MSEEPDMTNTTFDNRRSLRQLIIVVGFLIAFQDIKEKFKMCQIQINNKARFVSSSFHCQTW